MGMKKFRAYDCSNSVERTPHRSESYGPKENDIMRGLKKYCSVFGYEFIDDPSDAEVIITNDVFPKDILALNKPKVKRMDGVYWENRFKDRNELLNKAAMEADEVIFISEFSKRSFEFLYNQRTRNCHVIVNCVDSSVYFPLPKKFIPLQWVAAASNWARPEKRFDDLMVFASEILPKTATLFLIGKCDMPVPPNVWTFNYVEDEREINRCINLGHMFVNLSYRDPAPKVVCQAVNCHMPILYADSGGTAELVMSGVGIWDDTSMKFGDGVPRLDVDKMRSAYENFMTNYWDLRRGAGVTRFNYMEMLSSYFLVMNNARVDYGGKDE